MNEQFVFFIDEGVVYKSKEYSKQSVGTNKMTTNLQIIHKIQDRGWVFKCSRGYWASFSPSWVSVYYQQRIYSVCPEVELQITNMGSNSLHIFNNWFSLSKISRQIVVEDDLQFVLRKETKTIILAYFSTCPFQDLYMPLD